MLFALFVLGFCYEESLLQQGDPKYHNSGEMTGPGSDTHEEYFADIKKSLQTQGRGVRVGPYNSSNSDPSHDTYTAKGGASTNRAPESHEAQDGYRKNPEHIGTKFFTGQGVSDKQKNAPFFAQWGPLKKDDGTGNIVKLEKDGTDGYQKKFLTSGKVDYGWRFHELSEKAYTKEVRSTAGGNLTTLKDTTSAQFSNENEKVTNTADTLKNTRENTKVYKGASATTLLQTKAPTLPNSQELKIETTDQGYTRGTTNAQTTQSGTVGAGNSQETGTFTSQEGGNYVSVLEMPKVTAKKTGVVDVEWRGGDSYTTSKMMNGMKKFIKRAARGEKW